jgi:hypothetical protein
MAISLKLRLFGRYTYRLGTGVHFTHRPKRGRGTIAALFADKFTRRRASESPAARVIVDGSLLLLAVYPAPGKTGNISC